MECPVCGSGISVGDLYCAHCGARAPTQGPETPAENGAGVTQVLPPVQPPTPVDAVPQPSAKPPPRRDRWQMVAVCLGGALVVALVAVAALLLPLPGARTSPERETEATETVEETETPDPEAVEQPQTSPSSQNAAKKPAGYATAEKALKAFLDVDQSYKLLHDYGDTKEFAVAPPASDYTELVTVARLSDGSWKVVDSRPLAPGEAGPQANQAPIEEQAGTVVHQFLQALANKDYEGARAFTTGSASARVDDPWVRNGTLTTYKAKAVTVSNDGSTVRVEVIEHWDFGMVFADPDVTYTCVPSPNGYLISEVATP